SKLVPDPPKAKVVAEYFTRRARGESRRQIARDFSARGIRSPSGNARWSEPTLRAFEDNHLVYLGHLTYGRHNARLRKEGRFIGGRKWRERSEWVVTEEAHPAIIDERAAEVVVGLMRPQRSWTKRTASLSGILICGECSNSFWSLGEYYGCSSVNRWGRDACGAANVNKSDMDRSARQFIVEHIISPTRLDRTLRDLTRYVKKRRNAPEASRNDAERAKLEREVFRLLDLYAQGLVDEEHWRREYEPRRRRLEVLQASKETVDLAAWKLPTKRELVEAAEE
ncbi:recombinase family protein, partial [Nitrospinae bacterium AH_259_B05_G02_I21]|nr:recombinase family protein [Nitrospinae bacterium AH_259_B05_G02_I21]